MTNTTKHTAAEQITINRWKKQMDNKKTLKTISKTLEFETNEKSAIAYGLTHDGDEMKFELIARHPDIYELIEHLDAFSNAKTFDYLSIITWGWAAPLNSKGEIEGQPSKHPEKRRVKLIISGSNTEKGLIGSALVFSDSPDETIYDFGDATGSLSDAFSEFFKGD